MAVEYEGGVVLGADSRTSSGYVSLGTGRHMGLGTGGHMGLGTGGHMGLGIDVGIWVWALVGCEELCMCLSYCHDRKHPNIPMNATHMEIIVISKIKIFLAVVICMQYLVLILMAIIITAISCDLP